MTAARCKIFTFIIAFCILLTGCSKEEFSPYQHMNTLMFMTTEEEFSANQDYILGHSVEKLRQDITDRWDINLFTEGYYLEEKSITFEQKGSSTKLMGEYYMTTKIAEYNVYAFFTYTEDMLVDYTIYTVKAYHAEDDLH